MSESELSMLQLMWVVYICWQLQMVSYADFFFLQEAHLVFVLCFRLYNKDAIIEYLLDKSADRPNVEAVTHIRGMKV